MGMVELFGPGAAVLVGPKVLTYIQKPDAGKEGDDMTGAGLAALGWWASKKPAYKKYAVSLVVLGAVAHRRKLVLSGKMSEDADDYIIGEGVVSPED